MKLFAAAMLALAATVGSAEAQLYGTRNNSNSLGSWGTGSNSNSHYVAPQIRRDGDYVGGHYRTNPNSTTLDNYNTRGNYNPYTGQTGRRSPY